MCFILTLKKYIPTHRVNLRNIQMLPEIYSFLLPLLQGEPKFKLGKDGLHFFLHSLNFSYTRITTKKTRLTYCTKILYMYDGHQTSVRVNALYDNTVMLLYLEPKDAVCIQMVRFYTAIYQLHLQRRSRSSSSPAPQQVRALVQQD